MSSAVVKAEQAISSRSWEGNFERLKDFKEKNGHCRVPQHFADDPVLGNWVKDARKNRKTMSAEKRELLDGIGFDWSPHDTQWNELYGRLESFKREHGDCKVPESFDKDLRRWVDRQRTEQLKGGMPEDREAKLNLLGFPWADRRSEPLSDEAAIKWQENYAKLAVFKTANGHCNVPMLYKEDPVLGRFVKDQRRYKNGLTDGQRALLDGIGFKWVLRKRSFPSADEHDAPIAAEVTTDRQEESSKTTAAAAGADATDKNNAPAPHVRFTLLQRMCSNWKDKLGFRKPVLEATNNEDSHQYCPEGLAAAANGTTQEVTPSETIQLKSRLPNKHKEIMTGTSENEPQISKDAAVTNAYNDTVDALGKESDDKVASIRVTKGSKTATCHRTDDMAMVNVNKVAGKSDDLVEELHVDEAGDDSGGNDGNNHSEDDYIPRAVHLREVAGVKRKYKTKARRYFDERNTLRDEVKRLKVELHRAHLGNQLVSPTERRSTIL
jgi:hypothetical protein